MSKLQNIMFLKSDWTIKKCENFLIKHNMTPIKRVHITTKFYRYRLIEPKYRGNYRYRLITIQEYPNIKAVVMIKARK